MIQNKKTLEQIQKARRMGFVDDLSKETIILNDLVEREGLTWDEITEDESWSKDEFLTRKRKLVRYGVIPQIKPIPSRSCEGEAKELMMYLESKEQDLMFDGTSPSTWKKEVESLIEWFNLEHHMDLSERQEEILATDSVCRYLSEKLSREHGRMAVLLSQRRLSVEAIRLSIMDTSSGVRGRLRAVDEYSEYSLHSIEAGGKEWFWTSKKSNA